MTVYQALMPIGALMAARSKPAKLAKAMYDHLCELRGLGVNSKNIIHNSCYAASPRFPSQEGNDLRDA